MQKINKVTNPGKQRKKIFNAPVHIRHKLMAAPLSSELAASKGAKTLPVRKGDTVRIMRGDNKGFEGKVSRIDLKAYRIYLEGLTREKVDGTNIFLAVHPSKVQIRNLNLNDKWRKNILERKAAPGKKERKNKTKSNEAKIKKAPAKTDESSSKSRSKNTKSKSTKKENVIEAVKPKEKVKKASKKGGN